MMDIVNPFRNIWRLFFIFLWICFTSGEICTKSVCEYRFVVRQTRSMLYTDVDPIASGKKRSYQVRLGENGSLVLSPTTYSRQVPNISVPVDKVHTVDGHTRTIITINDQFPAPAIEVMEGSQVAVNVVNELQVDGLTIHFHGMHMTNNPWMDGTPYVTQCPVRPRESFEYRFIASPVGTHWYHSHLEAQRADGLFGPLIVHRSRPSLPYMTMMINDWYPMTSNELLLRSPFFLPTPGTGDTFHDIVDRSYLFDGSETSPLKYWSSLINGKGRHDNNTAPLSVFTVKPGNKHRIHLIFTSLEYYHRFSIDQHELTVVESDGHPVKPVNVESLIGFMGERYVVEITANLSVGQYWIRATVMRTGTSENPKPDGRDEKVLAILRYEGADDREPRTTPRACTVDEPCRVLNCAWTTYHKVWHPNRVCTPLADLRLDTSVHPVEEVLDEKDVVEMFLNLDFPIGSSINHHRNVLPRAPLFQDRRTWGITPCSRDCTEKGCLCTHVIDLPANKIVQLVMTSNRKPFSNELEPIPFHHPVHLHGHSFQVLKMGFAIANNQTGRMEKPNPDLVCDNDVCSKQHWSAGNPKGLNFKDPPIKDTVVVPGWGYTVVRFRSDNPGYWLLHCHQILHHIEGMSVIFNESYVGLPPPPSNFPTCTDFNMSTTDFKAMLERNKQCAAEKCPSKSKASSNVKVVVPFLMAVMVHFTLV